MALIRFEHYNFTYPHEAKPALQDINLAIEEGAFVLLSGETGSGKSTLLRQIKKAVAPAGQVTGALFYQEAPLSGLSPWQEASEIGLVMQNPEAQMVMEQVWQEIAFPLENMGWPLEKMRTKVAELVSFFGLTPLLDAEIVDLSGGQQQLINLASVLILGPKLLLLDEPLAQLDPIMVKDFLRMVQSLNEELGMTVIICEHRLEEILPMVERVIVLEDGRIVLDATAEAACGYFYNRLDLRGYVPPLARVVLAGEEAVGIPLTVKAGLHWAKERVVHSCILEQSAKIAKAPVLVAEEVYYRYQRQDPDVLSHLSLQVESGDFLAVLGANGAGKSTLLKVLLGVCRPKQGKVLLEGKKIQQFSPSEIAKTIGYLAQNPMAYFITERVEDEINHHIQAVGQKDQAYIKQLLAAFQLEALYHQHPYDLSGGQQQRLALFLVCVNRPKILLLDEPTKGLDPAGKEALAELLLSLLADGMAIVMVTHDLEFAAEYAKHGALLFQGSITDLQPIGDFFAQNHFYTTTINKVFGRWVPKAIKAADVEVSRA